jgi:hypothetical protein
MSPTERNSDRQGQPTQDPEGELHGQAGEERDLLSLNQAAEIGRQSIELSDGQRGYDPVTRQFDRQGNPAGDPKEKSDCGHGEGRNDARR